MNRTCLVIEAHQVCHFSTKVHSILAIHYILHIHIIYLGSIVRMQNAKDIRELSEYYFVVSAHRYFCYEGCKRSLSLTF